MAKKSQIQKFRETARALECDESEAAFNRALKKVAKALNRAPEGGCTTPG